MSLLFHAAVSVYAIVNVCGIVANLLVIVLIITSTPENLKRFALLLLNMAVIDFIANCAGLFSIPRLLPVGDGLLMISNGVCQLFSHNVCLVSYCTMISFHIHSTVCLPISFFYRWRILTHPAPSKLALLVAVLTVLPLLSVEFTTCIRCLDSDLKELVQGNEQLEHIDHELLIGFRTMKNVFVAESVFYLSFVFPIVYCIVFVIRRKVLETLENAGLARTSVSNIYHRKLLMVITMQAIVPLGLVFCSIQYLYIQLVDMDLMWMQYFCILPTNCVSLIQPLITLYFVAPYRRTLSNVFGKPKPIVTTSMWTTTHVTTLHIINVQFDEMRGKQP